MITSVDKFSFDLKPINWLGLHQEYLVPGEMEVIAALARSVFATCMVEIGCRDGRTAAVLLHNVPTLEWYCGIDVPMTYLPGLLHQRREMVRDPGHFALGDKRFELIIRDRGSLDLLPQDLPSCDLVFIDGDHSEKAVMHDSELARSIVRTGGLIVWHDASNGSVEVRRVLDRLAEHGWPIQTIGGTWLAICHQK